MTATTKERGGSFRELKDHLPLFDKAVHRHDRGWPHSTPEPGTDRVPKRRWRRVGIFHFPDEVEDEEARPRNAGSR